MRMSIRLTTKLRTKNGLRISKTHTAATPKVILDDGSSLLTETGDYVLLEGYDAPTPPSYLLGSDGSHILLSDGSRIILGS